MAPPPDPGQMTDDEVRAEMDQLRGELDAIEDAVNAGDPNVGSPAQVLAREAQIAQRMLELIGELERRGQPIPPSGQFP
jgi:hypothetical protein